jgi:hypothetical protein
MFRKTVRTFSSKRVTKAAILSFDVTMIAQRLPKSVQTRCGGSSRNASQPDHSRDFRWLLRFGSME